MATQLNEKKNQVHFVEIPKNQEDLKQDPIYLSSYKGKTYKKILYFILFNVYYDNSDAFITLIKQKCAQIIPSNVCFIKKLTSLRLAHNNIGDVGAIAIANSYYMKNVTIYTIPSDRFGTIPSFFILIFFFFFL
tara:strand:+ start:3182 stop:3583 length:402 start_codon:yes stop_codon:yes gene_type:complete